VSLNTKRLLKIGYACCRVILRHASNKVTKTQIPIDNDQSDMQRDCYAGARWRIAMCWNVEASAAMVVLGVTASVVTYRRGDVPAIWITLGFFTIMEALQFWGYLVLDQCGTSANRTVTLASYLHIAVQPFFINAFAIELVPSPLKRRIRQWVYGACAVSTAVMLIQILPLQSLGQCLPGSALCAEEWCTVAGNWHIAWNVPYNGLLVPIERLFGVHTGFPTYMLSVFVLPLMYGAWRFVIAHLLAGPILANALTTNPNEMPAIWCLFSIIILLIGLSPAIRKKVSAQTWWGWPIADNIRTTAGKTRL
jgi:hypothetical protein